MTCSVGDQPGQSAVIDGLGAATISVQDVVHTPAAGIIRVVCSYGSFGGGEDRTRVFAGNRSMSVLEVRVFG